MYGSLATEGWYELWSQGYHFAEDDKDIVIGAVITTLGVLYAILVTWILTAVYDKYKEIVVCVLTQDKDRFLLYRDERLPIVSHLLVGIVSFPLLGMIGLVAYKHALTGAVSVFVVSSILTMVWFVLRQLENPLKTGWFAERIPEEWFAIDIDEHFKLGRHRKDKAAAA